MEVEVVINTIDEAEMSTEQRTALARVRQSIADKLREEQSDD